jgi:diguanylate cyclase (GGDEF)-like protein
MLMLSGSYDPTLVLASLLMAMLASYTALDMAGRVAAARGRVARLWLAGGSIAMGIGIWSMHFLGMLAFRLPIPMGYDPVITFLSLLIAIASSAFALWMVCQHDLTWRRLSAGAVLMGAGVCSMHYTGMAAMRMMPAITYNAPLFALSVIIAVAASGAALWIAFHLRLYGARTRLLRAGAAVVMGLAIAGMHYTGMAAAQFPSNSTCSMAQRGLTSGWLAALIILFSLSVLSIALITSILDSRLESRTAFLASSLADANQELQFMALHDSLTKLPNRALFEDRLNQEIRNSAHAKDCFSVLLLDLDGFKQINDAIGHQAGDRLLVEVAERIGAAIRCSDTAARIGGDEFVLLARVTEPSDAASFAEKLVETIGAPMVVVGQELRVSASVGIALHKGQQDTAEELLKRADAAMCHAKKIGRNGYCFFDPSMNEDAQRQMEFLRDLRLAPERGQLILHYQPKFDAADGRVIGAEALVRWNHPERGLVEPSEFIPLAERTGLIVSVGNWVLDEACRQLSVWQAQGHLTWTIAVNLSAVQFNHPSLVPTVRRILQRHALNPSSLILEITESTSMSDPDVSMAILAQLSEMGVRISIDDFGTGYSSLLYLKRFPASELKIDRGFVSDLPHDVEDVAIVAAIVSLGRALGLEIVAEGVETIEQRDFLIELGCSVLQGFLLGRPVPPEQFALTHSRDICAPRSALQVSGRIIATSND